VGMTGTKIRKHVLGLVSIMTYLLSNFLPLAGSVFVTSICVNLRTGLLEYWTILFVFLED